MRFVRAARLLSDLKGMAVNFKDTSPEGTVLLLGIRFETQTSDKVYTYAALKAGGRWWFTGTGPTDASWTAVERWLERDGRILLWIDVLGDRTRVWTRWLTVQGHHADVVTVDDSPGSAPVDCRAEHGIGHPDCPQCWPWSERNPDAVPRP